MKNSNARRRLALFLAGFLIIALPGAALAESSSSTSTESLTVSASISLSGVPAALNYTTVNAGQVASAPEFIAAVGSNNASGWTFTVNATDLTAGGNTIAATDRLYVSSALNGGSPMSYVPGDFVLATTSTAGGANIFVTSRIAVPAAAGPGNYSGQAVFSASTNP